MKRLKPLNDFIFKKLFGENEVKDSLIAFLNAVLDKTDKDKLVTLEIIDNKELTRECIDDKTGILDVRAKTEDNTQIDIEVQLTNQHNMDKRTLFYWGRLFSEGISKGEDYTKLSKVITINILDFNYLDIDKFHSKFHLWEDDVKDYMLTDLVEIHFIEVSKFRELEEKDLKKDKLQRWLTFFNKDISDETLKELMDMDADIKKVGERLEYLSQDPKVRELYEAREKSLHERANMINGAKEEGRKEGIQQGIQEGIQQGIQQGKIELVKSLLLVGVEIEKIIKASGLTKEDIEKIKREVQH